MRVDVTLLVRPPVNARTVWLARRARSHHSGGLLLARHALPAAPRPVNFPAVSKCAGDAPVAKTSSRGARAAAVGGGGGIAPKGAAGAWRGRSCLSRMVCVAATVLADPARSLGARNQRSREPGRLDTRADSSPHVRGQLYQKQPTHTALGPVLRRAVPAPPSARRRVRHRSHRARTRSRGQAGGRGGDGCI
jgi:hypothetical protein